MNFRWDLEKNRLLKKEHHVCFEDVVALIMNEITSIKFQIIYWCGNKHPNRIKYPQQSIYIVCLLEYVHMVPFVRTGDEIFLKTIVPSRKMHRYYKGACDENG